MPPGRRCAGASAMSCSSSAWSSANALVQRRIGQDGVVARAAGVGERRAEDEARAGHVLARGLQRHGCRCPAGRARCRAAARPARGADHARAAAVVEHAGAGAQRRQGAEQQRGALVDAAGGEDAGVGDPVARGCRRSRAASVERHAASEARSVTVSAGRRAASTRPWPRVASVSTSPQSRSSMPRGRADAFVVAAVDDQPAARAPARSRHACAAISCSSLALGSRSSATSKGPAGGQGCGLGAAGRGAGSRGRNGKPARGKQRRQRVRRDWRAGRGPPESIASRLRRISSSAAASGSSGPAAHRMSSGVLPTKRRSKASRTRKSATSARLTEPARQSLGSVKRARLARRRAARQQAGTDDRPVEPARADHLLLHVLVVVDALQDQREEDCVVEKAAVPAAVAGAETRDRRRAGARRSPRMASMRMRVACEKSVVPAEDRPAAQLAARPAIGSTASAPATACHGGRDRGHRRRSSPGSAHRAGWRPRRARRRARDGRPRGRASPSRDRCRGLRR